MTLTEMAALYDQYLAYSLDNPDGRDASLAQKAAYINRAQRLLARQTHWFHPNVALSLVAGQGEYNLEDTTTPAVSAKVSTVVRVYINGNVLLGPNGSETYLYDLDAWDRDYSDWRDATTQGTPFMAMQRGKTLYLRHKPDAACVSAGKNWIVGVCDPATLTSTTDVSDFPDDMCEAAAALAAVLATSPTITDTVGMNALSMLKDGTLARVNEIRNVNYRALYGGMNDRDRPSIKRFFI